MMVIDLKEEKLKKDGFITVKALLEILERDSEKIKSIVVSTIDSDGILQTYSAMDNSTFKLIGMLEGSKQMLLNSLYE